MPSHAIIRRVALAWCAAALAAFAVLALTTGVPQGPEGALIAGVLQVRIQIGLLALAAAGLLAALRWPVAGGVVIVVAAAGVGVFAAFEYHPYAALAPFLALVIPGALLIGDGVRGGRAGRVAVATAGVLLVCAGAGYAADRVYEYAFGPTHPESAARLADGPVDWIWSGAPAPDGAVVVARLDEPVADVRLVVGTAAGPAGAVRRVAPSSRADEGAIVRFRLAGLRPGRTYHYALELGGRVDRTRRGRFTTVPDGPADVTLAFASCARRGSNGAVFDAIRAQRPDVYMVIGDMFYADIGVGDPDRFRDEFENTLSRPGQQALHLSTRIAYVWDDHDYGPDGAGASSPTRAAAQSVYREYVPHGPLPGGAATGPIYQAFTLGRVRVLMMDGRSERSPATAPDDARKRLIGDAQLQWLEREMLRARRRGQLVALVSPVPWIDAARAGADDWAGYATQRARISSFVARHGIQAVMLAGDAHMVALDDGSNADYSGTGRGGFPVLHGAPLDRHASEKGGPFSEGVALGSGQFGTMRVRDDGRRIVVTLSGMDWRGRTLVQGTYAFAL
ncbi:alkaline phosphatase D family protein [Miltoncostaea marina]|uniref:alkaline phosphatase D family protein n=1 Tax=Miltoncostaea marina TaxID=2843215 RepID=UPI001C3D683F|nr:alkaline phosphatase D family protein [Miltoncostaea marina]